jgi:predicted O-methyltransferase YrrM
MDAPIFSQDWHSHNIPALTEVLAKFKGQPNIHALEIGCFEGMGTLWMLNNILTDPSCFIECVDTFQGSAEHAHFGIPFETSRLKFLTNINNDRKVGLRVGTSSNVLAEMISDRRRQFDIVYVDASHMAVDVLSDLVLSWPLLKKGGVMFMDDMEWPGTDGSALHTPKPAITAFLNIYCEQLKILHMGYSVAVEKV